MTDLLKGAAYIAHADRVLGQVRGLAQQAAGSVRSVQNLRGEAAGLKDACEQILLAVRQEYSVELDHQWAGTSLRIRKPDGTWGPWVNLEGPERPASEIASAPFTGIAAVTIQAALEAIYAASARSSHAHTSAQITDLSTTIATAIAAIVGGTPPAGLDTLAEIAAAIGALQTGKQNALGFTPENAANRGAANGYAGLGSDGKVPSTQLPDTVLGAVSYKGTWDAATNTPTLASANGANKGHYRKVSVAGSTNIDGETDWKVGDWVISNGSAWEKVDNTDQVMSVAGLLGAITASDLRTALGLVIGTHVQAYDSDLAAIAALTTTSFGRGLLALADGAALRTQAGVGSMATRAVTISTSSPSGGADGDFWAKVT